MTDKYTVEEPPSPPVFTLPVTAEIGKSYIFKGPCIIKNSEDVTLTREVSDDEVAVKYTYSANKENTEGVFIK